MNDFPTWGSSPNTGQNLSQDINKIAPLVTEWHGASQGFQTGFVNSPPSSSGGFASTLIHKIGSIGSEGAHLVGGAAEWLGKETLNMGSSVIHAPINAYHFANDAYDTWTQRNAVNENLAREQALSSAWRNGSITTQDFQSQLKDILNTSQTLNNQIKATSDRISSDAGALQNSVLNTASAVLTVMTAGLTAPLEGIGIKSMTEATDYLSSAATRAMFAPVEQTIAKAGLDQGFMSTLAPNIQNAVKDSVYKVLVNSPKDLSAAQASRAAAVNIMLKYPLGYAAISNTGTGIYTDLQDKKYGPAIVDAAFNAALLFSGGPIGWGLKHASQAVKDMSVAMGLRPGSVIDEFSSYIGNGDRTALAKIATSKIAAGKIDEVKAVIVGVESNLKRANGNTALATANIVNHLENYVGWGSLTKISHEQAWENFVNYWKHSEGLQKLKVAGKIEGMAKNDLRPVVPGRFVTADKINIANASDQGGNWWEAYKNQYPNLAAANNPNLDRQITNIAKIEDTAQRRKAIMAIPTQIGLEGVPKDYADQMAKDGYVAIIPKSHNLPVVPFEETSGKLATQGAEGEFFVRASGPVPVMSSVGAVLTRAGLSPEMATFRTYELFKTELTKNLDSQFLKDYGAKLEKARGAKSAVKEAVQGNSGYSKEELAFMKKQGITPELLDKGNMVGGENAVGSPAATQLQEATKAIESQTTPEGTTDYISKKLRAFMAKPTRGGVMLGDTRVRAPITDMRQLTTRDLMEALGINKSDALSMKEAIMQTHLDLPRAVAGLGNRIMDYNYKYNPLASPYARVQGAARFTFNPFFRNMRLPFKGEFLAQAEANGKFLTIPGTNWLGRLLFSGRYKEFDGIIKALKEGKLLPGGLGDEAADISGTADLIKLGEHYPKNALYPVASLIADMARRANLDSITFLRKFPQEASDAATTVLSYDRNNSFLHSPLVKTLNFAFFPARFNIKVATIMAKNISRQDPLIQYAVVKGLMNAPSFFQSPQGQAWYAQNADIIGLFKYISPVATLSEVAQVLGSHGTSIGAYGELGGLPFGWIPALLESQGLIDYSQPYVSPTTGVVSKNYVPVTARGHIEATIEDLIQQLFSFPGATMGLPSKTKMSVDVAQALTMGEKTASKDFNKVTPQISPEQQQFQGIVQQLHSGNPLGQPNTTPQLDTSYSSALTSSQPTPLTIPKVRSVSSGTKKKKKSEYTPALLPGQSELGVIPGQP